MLSFRKLGICEQLNRICQIIGYKKPTKIQAQSIPHALRKRDIIGFAQTGSGKTIAYLLPIIQQFIKQKSFFSFLIIVPSRELAFQIAAHSDALGNMFGLKIAILVGGIKLNSQKILIKMKPHIMICTPGRLIDHLEKNSCSILNKISIFVLDEADRLLHLDFKKELLIILSELPKNKQSFLFSATMTEKIQILQKNNMKNPVKIKINKKYKPVATLSQNYIFVPFKFKDYYLIYFCNEFSGSSILCFVETQKSAERLAILMKILGFKVGCIHGGMKQNNRLEVLFKFRIGELKILIATDLAARGLDIPSVDLIINFDLPNFAKDYIHRVGRTARAGKSGRAINFITQYDINLCQKIEHLIEEKFIEIKHKPAHILSITKKVNDVDKKINSIFRFIKKKI
jgi:ATP-dependent RNA helicase DDX47/RRP3